MNVHGGIFLVLDYLIVGAGLFGAPFARLATDCGKSCLIIEAKPHIAGNCYTEKVEGIDVHKYGAHIFHCNSPEIWKFVNRFAEFNNYRHSVKVYNGQFLSFPINLMTLSQLGLASTPQEAKLYFEHNAAKIKEPGNFEEWVLSQVGEELYSKFFKDYTEKQWGKTAKNISVNVAKRIPLRLSFDDSYFSDVYQGIPKNGYTEMFRQMLQGIPLELNVKYEPGLIKTKRVVYSGAIDDYFNRCYGALEYRSLRFEESVLDTPDYQGCSVVNYTGKEPWTRIIEHNHFNPKLISRTVVTKEFPQKWIPGADKYYPVENLENNAIYQKYKLLAKDSGVIFGGRLGEYKYYDMHQVIGSAMKKFKETLE